jgi:hypothetical protein
MKGVIHKHVLTNAHSPACICMRLNAHKNAYAHEHACIQAHVHTCTCTNTHLFADDQIVVVCTVVSLRERFINYTK